ncbi:MAG: ATP-binding protein [Phycisphaerales bacterium]|nr:MAG: ATP-binding protein [Phycisphaerales bacterium]
MPWSPSTEDYLDVIVGQNPWHESGSVPSELAKPIRRPFAEFLWRAVFRPDLRRYQLVLGARRVGKTTVMYQTVEELIRRHVDTRRLWWFRLDHPLLIDGGLGELVRNVVSVGEASPSAPVFLFLDELAYARDWDLWLKTFYDEKWPIRLFGTSSSTAVLRKRRTESGVGRWEEQYLAPYLFTEYLALRDKHPSIEVRDSLAETIDASIGTAELPRAVDNERRRYIMLGGFPELLLLEEGPDALSELLRSQRILRSDAVERAVYKDIPQAFGVDEPMKLERLLYTLAGQVTGIISPNALAKDLGMSAPTLERYISFLTQSFIIFTLPNYSGSEKSVQRRGRKLYFVDCAVRNAALQRGVSPLEDPAEMGVLLENVVASHLHALCQQKGVRLYHWRQHQFEVDLVYDDASQPLAFEVATSPTHSLKSLREFQQRSTRFHNRCFLVCPGVHAIRPEAGRFGIGRLPLDLLLVAIGVQTQQALRQRLEAPPGAVEIDV